MIRAWNSRRFCGTIRQGEPLRRRCSLTAKDGVALSLTRPFLPRGHHTHDQAPKTHSVVHRLGVCLCLVCTRSASSPLSMRCVVGPCLRCLA
jgi:hypothetical protein